MHIALIFNVDTRRYRQNNAEWDELLMENGSFGGDRVLNSEEATRILSQNCAQVSQAIYKKLQRYALKYAYQNENGDTLWHTCQKSIVWTALATQLKAANVSMETTNNKGKTPWLEAIEKNNVLAAQWLKENNANTAALDSLGNPAWFLAGPLTHDTLRIWALEKVDTLNYAGQNDFIYALSNQKSERAKKLFEMGPDLSIRDNRGKTALHYAAQTGNVELTVAIVKRNPEQMYAEDARRKKPIDLAESKTRNILQEYMGLDTR